MSTWKQTGTAERDLGKFVRQGTVITVDVTSKPLATTVEGRYGKRRMYIVETKEFGAVYVSPLQAIRIADLIGDLKSGSVVVTL